MKKDIKHFQGLIQLVLGKFPQQFASLIYPYEKGHDVITYEAMDGLIEPGPDEGSVRHDVMFTFIPENGRTGLLPHKEPGQSCATHVSVRLEADRRDLAGNGGGLDRYLGATDYFFLAVPKRLLEDAIRLIQRQPFLERLDHIGLIEISSGDIVIHPKPQRDKSGLRQAILCQRAYEQGKRVCKPDPVYLVHTTKADPSERPRFCETGPFAVNKDYLDIVRRNLYK